MQCSGRRWTHHIIQVMAESPKPLPLDYRNPPRRRGRYVDDAPGKLWRFYRVVYRVGLFVVLGPLIIHFGAHIILFGKLTALAPAGFVSEAQGTPTRVVRAMMEYRRDTGNWTNTVVDLDPKYLMITDLHRDQDGATWTGNVGEIYNGQYFYEADNFHDSIKYDFNGGATPWSVSGPMVSGVIPLPPVTLPAESAPATVP